MADQLCAFLCGKEQLNCQWTILKSAAEECCAVLGDALLICVSSVLDMPSPVIVQLLSLVMSVAFVDVTLIRIASLNVTHVVTRSYTVMPQAVITVMHDKDHPRSAQRTLKVPAVARGMTLHRRSRAPRLSGRTSSP